MCLKTQLDSGPSGNIWTGDRFWSEPVHWSLCVLLMIEVSVLILQLCTCLHSLLLFNWWAHLDWWHHSVTTNPSSPVRPDVSGSLLWVRALNSKTNFSWFTKQNNLENIVSSSADCEPIDLKGSRFFNSTESEAQELNLSPSGQQGALWSLQWWTQSAVCRS